MAERWLPIPGWQSAYEVSETGRVRSIRTGRELAQLPNRGGYMAVSLSSPRRRCEVQTLVLAAFVGPRPQGTVSRHLDGDPTNNALTNLKYGTQGENLRDAVRHGTHAQASKKRCPRGHLYDAANTYVQPSAPTTRQCRACNRLRVAAYKARRLSAVTP